MGLLTAEQLSTMDLGSFPVKQTWQLLFQTTPGGAWNISTTFDSGQPGGINRIVDAGSREIECYNQAIGDRGDLLAGEYEFSVDNNDGYFTIGKAHSIWDYDPIVGPNVLYDPAESLIQHKVFLFVSGAWEELSFMTFRGSIEDIIFESVSNSEGSSVDYIARFLCVNKGFSKIKNRVWTSDDGTETNLVSTFTGADNAAT